MDFVLFLQFENKDQLYEFLVECDVIVYDITEDPDQIDEAVWAVSGIKIFKTQHFKKIIFFYFSSNNLVLNLHSSARG